MTSTPNLPPPPPKAANAPPSTAPPDADSFGIGKVDAAPRWRVVLNCNEGWGKTSCMAHAPNPLMIMCGREVGFKTLRVKHRVPDIDAVHITDWPTFVALLRSAVVQQYDTLCVDSLGALYALLHAHVLASKFSNDEQKFQSYGRGISVCETEWNTMLDAVERTDADVIFASHAEAASFNNPSGENYHRYVGNIPKQLWALTAQWADAVLFGTFITAVDQGKATGGTERAVYTEHRASHDAKNRFGLEPFISVPNESDKVFSTIFTPIITKG